MTLALFNHSPLEGKKKKKCICSYVERLAREASFHFPLFYFLLIKKIPGGKVLFVLEECRELGVPRYIVRDCFVSQLEN